MENSIYLGLSRQMTLRTNMDIIANNVANANTSGFRAQNLVFEEFISDPRGNIDDLSFVQDQSQYQVTDPGPIKVTGNSLDVALIGPGYMGVQAPDGQVAYSRSGELQIAPNGSLVTSAGLPVAGAGGSTITIPEGSREIKIDENGFISNQDGQIGQIMIVEFENVQTLEAIGNSLYKTDTATAPATETKMRQGQVEGSNVKSVIEMTRMIDTLRSFQSIQQVLQTENERLRGAIQKLTGGS